MSRPALRDSRNVEVAYWEARLVRRPYPKPTPQWAVRIEHDGFSQYFPLGSANSKLAARKASKIYQTVRSHGWKRACQRFVREITLGIHWVSNPVAWTYTTFHTELSDSASKAHDRDVGDLRVTVIEADRGVRLALQHWISAHPNTYCAAAYESAEQAFKGPAPAQNELWLVNDVLPDASGRECCERLRRIGPETSAVTYCIYEDSDRLFLAAPGGASGYLFQRTPAARLLDPVAPDASNKSISPSEMMTRVKKFFQNAVAFPAAAEAERELSKLTAREYQILELLSKGYVDKEIAIRLGISGWTVHGHVKNIFEKLGVHTRTEAAVRFLHK
jgi:DNA-binding NarL/FixJ family response regulator